METEAKSTQGTGPWPRQGQSRGQRLLPSPSEGHLQERPSRQRDPAPPKGSPGHLPVRRGAQHAGKVVRPLPDSGARDFRFRRAQSSREALGKMCGTAVFGLCCCAADVVLGCALSSVRWGSFPGAEVETPGREVTCVRPQYLGQRRDSNMGCLPFPASFRCGVTGRATERVQPKGQGESQV